jgi:flagellum-specific peptidoglycan hydrolase FlgJ
MKKLARFLLILVFLSHFTNAQGTAYIQKYDEIAKNLSAEFGIPKSIILSVAIVESGYGRSKVARKLNNHFGIVGKNRVRWSRYKQYASAEDSFRDFCIKMSGKKFYANLKGNPDYLLWIKKISYTGYSTRPRQWQKKIKTIIKKHNLE